MVREVCSDTTDGQKKAVDEQILRELLKQVREGVKRKREQTNSADCKESKVGCCLFFLFFFILLILKSSIIRMRGREHVA